MCESYFNKQPRTIKSMTNYYAGRESENITEWKCDPSYHYKSCRNLKNIQYYTVLLGKFRGFTPIRRLNSKNNFSEMWVHYLFYKLITCYLNVAHLTRTQNRLSRLYSPWAGLVKFDLRLRFCFVSYCLQMRWLESIPYLHLCLKTWFRLTIEKLV